MALASRFLDVYTVVFMVVWLSTLILWVGGCTTSRLGGIAYGLLSCLLILFSATRYETGYDWPAYEDFYQLLNEDSDKYLFEFGFVFIAKLARALSLDFVWFQFVVSALQVLLVTVFIRKFFGDLSFLGLAVYFTLPDLYLIHSFSLMRQGLALGFFLCGAAYLFERKRLVAALFFFGAISFHASSLFAIFAFLFIWGLGVNYIGAVAAVVIVVVAYILGINIPGGLFQVLVQIPFFEKYGVYTSLDTPSANLIYKVLFTGVFSVLFIFACYRRDLLKKSNRYKKHESVLFGLSFMAIFCSFFFWALPTLLSRFQAFFIFFLLLNVFRVFEVTRLPNRALLCVLVMAMSTSLFAKFVLTKISIVYFPYQSSFATDIERRSTGLERTEVLYEELRWLWKGV